MVSKDFIDGGLYRVGVGDIRIVSGDFGDSAERVRSAPPGSILLGAYWSGCPGFSSKKCCIRAFAWRSDSSSAKLLDLSNTSLRRSKMKHTVQIHNGDLSAARVQRLAHDETQSTGTSSHNPDLTLQGEGGEGALEVHAATALDRSGLGHVLLLWVLEGEGTIGTGVQTLMLTSRLTRCGGVCLVFLLRLQDTGCGGKVAGRYG